MYATKWSWFVLSSPCMSHTRSETIEAKNKELSSYLLSHIANNTTQFNSIVMHIHESKTHVILKSQLHIYAKFVPELNEYERSSTSGKKTYPFVFHLPSVWVLTVLKVVEVLGTIPVLKVVGDS